MKPSENMSELTKADLVWNRACLADGATELPGDRALEAMVTFHGVAMNGGVLHALQHFSSDELEDARSGYRFFDLERAAALLDEWKLILKTSTDLSLWEAELDRRYYAIVPDDSVLFAHFESIFRRSPSEFAPI
jgi:hypothetical protein